MIGSSDVPAILGLPHPATGRPSDIWPVYERVTGLRERFADDGDAATRRGHGLEGALLFWFQREHPDESVIPNKRDHQRDGWMSARPDAYRVRPGRLFGVVEAKTDRVLDREHWRTPPHGFPAYHEAQVRWQMAVLGGEVEAGALVVYHPMSETYLEYEIERDARIEAALVRRVRDWYERYVLGGELPAFTSSSSRTLARLNPASDRKARRASPRELVAWQKAWEYRHKSDQARVIADQFEGQIMAGMVDGVTDLLGADGRRLVRWRPGKDRRRVNLDRLRREMPDIVEQYTEVVSGTRPFILEKL